MLKTIFFLILFSFILSFTVNAAFNTSNPNQYYVIINGTGLNQATFLSGVSNIGIYNLTSTKWIIFENASGNINISRARVLKVLFYGTDGSNPRVNTTWGGPSGLKYFAVSDSRDIGKQAYYMWGSGTGASATVTASINSTLNSGFIDFFARYAATGNYNWAGQSYISLNSATSFGCITDSEIYACSDDRTETDNAAYGRTGPSSLTETVTSRAGQSTGQVWAFFVINGSSSVSVNNANYIFRNYKTNYSMNLFTSALDDPDLFGSTNSCTYSGTGNWAINASHGCNITATNLKTNNVTIIGASANTCCTRGLSNITNYTRIDISNSYVYS